MRRFRQVRSTLLWLVWALLAIVWIATLWRNWLEGKPIPTVLAVLDLLLLFVLYFAEGIELAITDLLDKEPNQLRDASARRLLAEIQARSGFFFAQRQIFVVVIISVLSLTTAYPWIYVPFYGKVTLSLATFWFSLIFTTLTVLWFCQVTPKRLAVINSEKFLRQSGLIWRAIKAISVIGLPDPSDLLVYAIQKNSDYSEGRYLLPGRATHYDISAHLFGFALDRLRTSIVVRPDGSGEIRKRFLVLFIRGQHSSLYGSLNTRSAFASKPQIRMIGLYVLPAPERLETIADRLDAVFDETAGGVKSANLIEEWASRVGIAVDTQGPGRTGQEASWSIEGSPLPESLWPKDVVSGSPRPLPLAALSFEISAEIAAGGFDSSGGIDEYPETVSLPSRSYSISVKPAASAPLAGEEPARPHLAAIGGCAVALAASGADMPEEALRVTQSAVAGKGNVDIEYPLQGACYTVWWRIFEGSG